MCESERDFKNVGYEEIFIFLISYVALILPRVMSQNRKANILSETLMRELKDINIRGMYWIKYEIWFYKKRI